MGIAYWTRVVISLLAAGIVGLCFTKVVYVHSTQVRNLRVIGLGLLCSAIAWGTVARRDEPFKPWLIVVVIGLLVAGYGMVRSTPDEKSKVKVKSTESP